MRKDGQQMPTPTIHVLEFPDKDFTAAITTLKQGIVNALEINEKKQKIQTKEAEDTKKKLMETLALKNITKGFCFSFF